MSPRRRPRERTPSDQETTRRNVLRAGAAALGLGAVGSLAGCSNPLGGGSQEPSSSPPEDTPEDADFMLVTDVVAILGDEAIRAEVDTRLEALASANDAAPNSVEAALNQVEQQSGLDPRELDQVLFFGQTEGAAGSGLGPVGGADGGNDSSDGSGSGGGSSSGGGSGSAENYAGFVIYSSWAEADVVDAISDAAAVELQEQTYAGRTIYQGDESGAFASLGGGRFVLGSPQAARDVIDVSEGNAEPASGELRDAYDAASSGYMRFGLDVSAEDIPELPFPGGAEMSQSIAYVYGSVYADGDRRGVRFRIEVDGEESATEIEETAQAVLELLQQGGMQPTTQALVENIEVSREGTTVTLASELAADEFAAVVGQGVAGILAGAGTAPVTGGAGGSRSTTPE